MTRRARAWWIVAVLLVTVMMTAIFFVATETGLRLLWPWLARALPGEVTVKSVEGKLIGPVSLQGLHYHQDGTSLTIERLDADWRPGALLLGKLRILRLHVDDDAALSLPPAMDKSQPRASFKAPSLPLTLDVADARLESFHVIRADAAPVLVESARLNFRLDDQALELRSLEIHTETLRLAARGRIALAHEITPDLRTDWSITLTGYEKIEGHGAITGTLGELRLDQRLEAPASARLRGVLRDWPEQPRWEARLEADGIDAREVNPSWPQLALSLDATGKGDFQNWQVDGKLRLRQEQQEPIPGVFVLRRAPETWVLDRLEIGAPKSATRLIANGQYSTQEATRALTLNAEWRGLTWPPAAQAMLTSPQGQLRLTGTPERYRLHAQATIAGRYAPRGQWRMVAQGDASRIRFERIQARLAGGDFVGQGHIAWRPALAWKLAFAGAAAELSTSGTLTDHWDLRWRARVDNLGALLPGRGTIATQGRVTGARAAPRIVATARVHDFLMQAHRLARLDADMHLDLAGGEESRIALEARGLQIEARTIDSLSLQGHGRASSHRLTGQLRGAGTGLFLDATGNYRDQTWNGTLTRAEFHSTESGHWTLTAPGPFRLGPGQFDAGEWCWSAKDSRLCAQAQRRAGEWSAAAMAERVPLSLLQPLLPETLRVSGTLNGQADGRLTAAGRIFAKTDIRFSAGALSYIRHGEAAATTYYDNGRFRLDTDERGLEGRLTFALRDGDSLEGQVRLPGIVSTGAMKNQAIEGNLSARVGHLELLPVFFPGVENTRGLLRAKAAISGTLGEPRITGRATLTDGTALLPRLGLTLKSITLTAENDAEGHLRFAGQLRSGGELRFQGGMQWPGMATRDWTAELSLKGERVEITRLPEAWILASPDLRLKARPRRVEVNGEVLIPEAKIEPRQMNSAVPVSRDVVVVNAPDDLAQARTPWDLYSKVRVVLGDKVRFKGFGLIGNIAGSVTATDDPGKATTAGGELKIVDGKYKAYGRELDIERGRLIFAGGPIDNPGVDARAVRRVDEVLAGISVRGTLRSPVLTLFSEPPMSQADALSYLILGQPLHQASSAEGQTLMGAAGALTLTGGGMLARQIGARFGFEQVAIESGDTPEEASLVVGRYLSPKLFVAYSVGLFEQINLLRLRYQLSSRWTVQTETGTHSGADLLFTIER